MAEDSEIEIMDRPTSSRRRIRAPPPAFRKTGTTFHPYLLPLDDIYNICDNEEKIEALDDICYTEASLVGYMRILSSKRRLLLKTQFEIEDMNKKIKETHEAIEKKLKDFVKEPISPVQAQIIKEWKGKTFELGIRAFFYPFPKECTLCEMADFLAEPTPPLLACLNTSCTGRICGECFQELAYPKTCPWCRESFY